MNRHMRGHAKQLNIKTTHLASLTAVFHSRKQPRPPTTSSPHPPATDTEQGNNPAGPSGQDNSSEVPPEVLMSRLGDAGADDSDRIDSDEMSEGGLEDFDSEEFESSDEDLGCEMRDHQVPLEFELRAAKAGNVHRRNN